MSPDGSADAAVQLVAGEAERRSGAGRSAALRATVSQIVVVPEHRPIRQDEVAVIRAAIERAGREPVESGVIASLDRMAVVSRCGCGCSTVTFAETVAGEAPYPIADGIGLTPRGGRVGVLVWGRSDLVSELEIYDLGAGDGDLVLPVPSSITPFKTG